MGEIKRIILAVGLILVLLNNFDVRCQNIKGVKSNEKGAADDGSGGAVLGQKEVIHNSEVRAENNAKVQESQLNPQVADKQKESASKKEGAHNEDPKELHAVERAAFIEDEKAQNGNPEKATTESHDHEGKPVKEVIVIDGANLNALNEDVIRGMLEEANEKDLKFVEAGGEEMTDVGIKDDVKESNLYFLQMLAFLSSIFMQLTSVPTIFKILKKKTTGEMDGLPYVMLLYSSFLWLVYGMLIENTAVVLPNFSGLSLGLLYTVVYHKYCKSMWLKQKLYSYYKLCGCVTFMLYVFIYFMTFEQYVLSAGLLASISSVINFGAPLSSLREVMKKRDTSSIPLEMTVGSLICSFLWLLYGMILRDAFLIIPNLGGLALGVMQIVLIVIYASKEPFDFIGDESCFTEQKDSYRPDGIFYPDPNAEYENRISDVSTTAQEPVFDFTYDETSPLTSDVNFTAKKAQKPNEHVLKSTNSVEEVTVLNF